MTEQAADTTTTTTDSVPIWAKPVAVVYFEGTLVDEKGEWKPDIWDKLTKLRRTHFVTVVSPKAKSIVGANIIMLRLYAAQVPFDDVFLGVSCPEADRVYCDTALSL